MDFDRLNEHYQGVVGLSRLVLRHGAFETGRGAARASGFLMDMNVVFQEFLTQALREVLGASRQSLRSDSELQGVTLDREGKVTLKPDLTWWDGPDCRFVGDAKYKNLTGERVPNADLYQMLSYATALGLPGGLLIYAQGEADTASYTVRGSGTRLERLPRWISPAPWKRFWRLSGRWRRALCGSGMKRGAIPPQARHRHRRLHADDGGAQEPTPMQRRHYRGKYPSYSGSGQSPTADWPHLRNLSNQARIHSPEPPNPRGLT